MAGHNNWPYIINLGNSIIGVAVLAMPFCFKQCGILLGMIVLLFCTWLTLISCQLLMRAGIHSRRRSYEFLAYHTHGATGKLISELGMIGMQVGTLIAQIVVIGDLGPAIFSKFLGIENTSGLRTFLILVLCLGVGLPLGLLKDLRAVSRASTVCISFYCIFILYVIGLSLPNIRTGEWYHKVSFWRPEGFFQCLPILSFSFGCQTQLFLLYDALPDPSLKAISGVISSAVNLCAVAYLLVGFFGYVAFHDIDVPGDVISVFPNTFIADLMKICFVFSIVITFPVIIFPCRSSIYTLVFAKLHVDDLEQRSQKTKVHDDVIDSDGYLPEKLFKWITVFIVISCMILGILIPNVEFVLGINGAIMGTLICYIFPAMFFLKVMGNKQDSRGMAQIVFVFGVTILLLSTFATLSSQGKADHHSGPVQLKDLAEAPMLPRDIDGHLPEPVGDKVKVAEQLPKPLQTEPPAQPKGGGKDEVIVKDEARQEPPNPDPPDMKEAAGVQEKLKEPIINSESVGKKDSQPKDPPVVIESPADIDKKGDKKTDKEIKDVEDIAKAADANKAKERELQEKEKKQDELLQQLEKHREEQEKLIEEQRQLLKEFKDHHEKDLKNELDQEKEKLQQQMKREAIQEDIAQHAQQARQLDDMGLVQPVRVPADNVRGVQPAAGQIDNGKLEQAVRPQEGDSPLGQPVAGDQRKNLKVEQPAQQGRASLDLLIKDQHQQQQADPQQILNARQEQQKLPLDNLQNRRINVNPGLEAAPGKNRDDTGGAEVVSDTKQKKLVFSDGQGLPGADANVPQQQGQQLREAGALRQANPNLVKDAVQPQNPQQALAKESDPVNDLKHQQVQQQPLVNARQGDQEDHGGRVKRSVEDEGKLDGKVANDEKIDVNKLDESGAREQEHVISNEHKDKLVVQGENVVHMNMGLGADKMDLNEKQLDKSFHEKGNVPNLKLAKDVEEIPVADAEVNKVNDIKRNEEMRRKLKSLNSDEMVNSINVELIQPLTNDIENVAGRRLLEHQRRD